MQSTIDNVVEKWLNVARIQYNRGLYQQSENSLLRALEFRDHLNPQQIELISSLMSKTANSKNSVNQSIDRIDQAEHLAGQGKLLQAKGYIGEVLKQKNLDQDEKSRAVEFNKQLDTMIKDRKKQMADLYNESVKYYKNNELKQAQYGFIQVAQSGLHKPVFGETAEKYLKKIKIKLEKQNAVPIEPRQRTNGGLWTDKKDTSRQDEPVEQVTQPQIETREQWIQQDASAEVSVVVDTTAEPVYANNPVDNTINKNNIVLDYVKVIVLDAEERATKFAGRSEFNQAFYIIKNAEIVLEKYKNQLGEGYSQYSMKLANLKNTIQAQKQDWQSRWEAKNN
jgi:hypothetical protein